MILRTAGGSPVTVSQVRRFQELGARVVAADADPLSCGLFVADAGRQVPRVSDADYIDAILQLCTDEGVQTFFPSMDDELLLIDQNRERFAAIGVGVVLSPGAAIEICTDKLATSRFFASVGVPTPTWWLPEDRGLVPSEAYPVVVKPRSGRGSTNVFVARNPEELAFFCDYVPRAIIQARAPGVELTIDVLAELGGEPALIVPRRRIATDSGISSKGVTVWNDEVVGHVAEISRRLELHGPANIQCFVADDGEIQFIEINARLAGTAILADAAGAPLFDGMIRLGRGERPVRHIAPLPDIVGVRHWAEQFLSRDEAEAFGWRAT